ncbi:MAG: carboxylating nicotinate-nucleotide diphosphorylase [Myxococcales bacterium]|nr:carboxylating nicotinate-nucleotide diphosphorylase [Myxococcales bacterium]
MAALIDLALEEDLGRGDVTSEAVLAAEATAGGAIIAKQRLVLFGVEIAEAVFRRVDVGIRFVRRAGDGEELSPGDVVATVDGPARAVLGAERTALNFLQRLSGIATLSRAFVRAVEGTRATVVDTRKTAPGWRALDKAAVRAGGAANHRADLASGILIKDNHIAACGSVGEAVRRARRQAPHGLRVEVEVSTLAALDEALAAGAEVLLLDNVAPQQAREMVERAAGRALIEVSGGVRLSTVRAYAEAGVDRISAGALTHSAPAVDLSLEIEVRSAG